MDGVASNVPENCQRDADSGEKDVAPSTSGSKRKQRLLPKKECTIPNSSPLLLTTLKRRVKEPNDTNGNERLNKARSLADQLRSHIRPRRKRKRKPSATIETPPSSLHSSLHPKDSAVYFEWKKNIWNTKEPVVEILNIKFEDSSEGEEAFPKFEDIKIPSSREVLIEVFAEGSAGADVEKDAEEKADNKFDFQFEWKCPLCTSLKSLPDFSAFRAHVEEHHKVEDCSLCPTTPLKGTSLELHLTRVHLKRWTCDECVLDFTDLLQYGVHREEKHRERDSMHILLEGTINCNLCSKEFRKASAFHDHFLTVHDDLRQCAQCDLQFRGASRILRHHYSTHLNCLFACAANVMGCDYTNCSPDNIKQHVQSRHNSTFEKRTCEVCQRKISNSVVFKEHMKAHEKDKERNFFCDICGRVFTTIDTMRVHRRRHFEEERKFECQICGKAFFTNNLRNAHELLHNGTAKPYKCKETGCEKAFRTRNKLHCHRLSHRGECPYRCDQCSAGFPSINRLNKHTLSMHNAQKEELIKKKKKTKTKEEETSD